jgi:predicted secreted protein
MIFGVPIGSLIAIYFVCWWICLFVTLPFGVRSQRESGDVVRGSDPGAPAIPHLWPKLIATSILAALATWVLVWGAGSAWLQAYLR